MSRINITIGETCTGPGMGHFILANKKTTRHFEALGEAIDVDSEAYCWRRSGFFWRMRASLGLACAQATTLCTQVFGKARPRSRAGRPRA